MGFDCTWSTASAARCVSDATASAWSVDLLQASWSLFGAVLGGLVVLALVLLFLGRARG